MKRTAGGTSKSGTAKKAAQPPTSGAGNTAKPLKTTARNTAKSPKTAAGKTAASSSKAGAGATRRAATSASTAGVGAAPPAAALSPADEADAIVQWLRNSGTKATRDGMARYAIPSDKAFGVPINVMLKYAKGRGRTHEVALALWNTGWYEARMMATYLAEPERMTAAEMEKWCDEFDSWAICDTACWHVFERSPHAWAKIEKWSRKKGEIQKRTACALLATIALHDKATADAPFAKMLPMVEQAAHDERNFVFKGANWALRAIGLRSAGLCKASMTVAERLAESPNAGARWAGKDALRKLSKQSKK